jgi:hypothetical protein
MNRNVFPTTLLAVLLLFASIGRSSEPSDPPPLPSGGSGVVGIRSPMLDDSTPTPEIQSALHEQVPVPLAGAGIASSAARLAFDGIINTTVDVAPPDTHIAVGRGYTTTGRVVMVTNLSVQIWDKQGTTIAPPLLLDTMFGANVFDPKVLFDQHSERFFIVALEGKSTTPGLSVIHIAVSSDGTPDNLTSDWTFLSGSSVTLIGGASTWADYPGFGADASALFVTANLFSFSSPVTFHGMKVRVFDKADLLAGIYSYNDLDYDASSISVTTTQPAHVFGSTSNGVFYLISRLASTSYRLFAISGHPAAPTATTNTFAWSAGAFIADRGADQCDQALPDVVTLRTRIQSAIYRDDHIWLTLTSDPDLDDRTEVVWQQIATNAYPLSDPTVSQAGFIDATAADGWTYMPALGVNAAGDAAIVYTQSSASECPNMYYTTRTAGDAAGSFRDPAMQRASDGFYDSFLSDDPDRWGDYAAVAIDPSDDCFWLASEFVWSSDVANSEWGTHIANVCRSLPVPALPAPYLLGLALLLAIASIRRVARLLGD